MAETGKEVFDSTSALETPFEDLPPSPRALLRSAYGHRAVQSQGERKENALRENGSR